MGTGAHACCVEVLALSSYAHAPPRCTLPMHVCWTLRHARARTCAHVHRAPPHLHVPLVSGSPGAAPMRREPGLRLLRHHRSCVAHAAAGSCRGPGSDQAGSAAGSGGHQPGGHCHCWPQVGGPGEGGGAAQPLEDEGMSAQVWWAAFGL